MIVGFPLLAQQSFQGITVTGGSTLDSPTDVQNLLAWWDASSVVVDTSAPSNSVSQILDLSGNGHALSQGTKANQPSYLLNQIAGRPVLSFLTDDRLLGTTSITNYASGNDVPFSYFTVLKVNNQANEASMAWGNATNSSAQFIVLRPDIGSGANSVFRDTRTDDTATGVNMNINGSTNGIFMIHVHSFSGTAFTSRIVANYTNVFSSGSGNVGVVTLNTFAMGCFSRNAGFTQHLDGMIAEMGLYSRGISTNEQNTIIRYLQHKYSITPP